MPAFSYTPFPKPATLPLALALAALLALAPVRAQEGTEGLDIITATGPHHFSVEVMRTDAGREKGLMFRKNMPKDRGMLFDFKTEQPVMMWMKNTYLPLDMVFISRNGKVVNVAENAEPLSEAIIASDGPVFAVLEVNAGEARQIGVKPGDEVHHSMFKH